MRVFSFFAEMDSRPWLGGVFVRNSTQVNYLLSRKFMVSLHWILYQGIGVDHSREKIRSPPQPPTRTRGDLVELLGDLSPPGRPPPGIKSRRTTGIQPGVTVCVYTVEAYTTRVGTCLVGLCCSVLVTHVTDTSLAATLGSVIQ